jgi:hypothetical protein
MVALSAAAGPPGSSARADWINLTGAETAPNIAEIYVEDDRVRLVFEAYVGDLETFHDLLPDVSLGNVPVDRPALPTHQHRFLAELFRFVTESGQELRAEVKLVEPRLRKDRFSPFAGMTNPITRQPLRQAPEDKRVIYGEIEYPFTTPPKTLTIVPPLDPEGIAVVDIGFIAYHKVVPIIDFRYLSRPATVNLDWTDPWYSRFDNPNLKRHHKSALMSFLYVEPNQVRHEVLTRVKDLEAWIDLGLVGNDSIEPEEWPGLQERVGAFLIAKNPVLIDGEPITPSFTRADFVSVGLRGIQVIEEPTRLDIATAVMGVILTYPTDSLPDLVTAQWELFTDQIQRVPTTAIDPAGPLTTFVDPEDPMIQWRNHLVDYRPPTIEAIPLGADRKLRLPGPAIVLLLVAIAAGGLALRPRLFARGIWIGAALAGALGAASLWSLAVIEVDNPFAGPPDPTAAGQIVARLAANLHNALREREQARRRDALAVSVSERQSATVLPEVRRALAIEIQGGGIARVDAVSDVVVKDVEGLGAGFRTLAEWTAEASAGHWGHAHRRSMRFSALMELMPVAGAWKLVGLTVVNVRPES